MLTYPSTHGYLFSLLFISTICLTIFVTECLRREWRTSAKLFTPTEVKYTWTEPTWMHRWVSLALLTLVLMFSTWISTKLSAFRMFSYNLWIIDSVCNSYSLDTEEVAQEWDPLEWLVTWSPSCQVSFLSFPYYNYYDDDHCTIFFFFLFFLSLFDWIVVLTVGCRPCCCAWSGRKPRHRSRVSRPLG